MGSYLLIYLVIHLYKFFVCWFVAKNHNNIFKDRINNYFMIRVDYNYGFVLSYCGVKEHAERCMLHHQGIMYSDKLNEIAKQIAENWIHGDFSLELHNKERRDYYFNEDGNFAMVKQEMEKNFLVCLIRFVSSEKTKLGTT